MDDRAGRRLEAIAGRRWRGYATTNRWRLIWVAFAVALVLALGAVPALLVYGPFGRGVAVGALVTTLVGFVVVAVAEDSGAYRFLQGAVGEQQTAAVLRRLERRGWHVINDVAFAGFNVDHVAIGPAGVIAVETKTNSGRWDFLATELNPFAAAAVRQTRAAARKIRLLLSEVGDLPVVPLLVVWGADVVVPPQGLLADDVRVVLGRHARAFLDDLAAGSAVLDEFTIDCAAHHVGSFVWRRDRHASVEAGGRWRRRRSSSAAGW
jgi:hypothetical protein